MKRILFVFLILVFILNLVACSTPTKTETPVEEETDPREFYYALHETAEVRNVSIEYLECTNETTEEYRIVGCRFNIHNKDNKAHFLNFNMYTEKETCEFYGTSEIAVEFELVSGLTIIDKWVYFKVPLEATEVKLVCEIDLYETEFLTFEII